MNERVAARLRAITGEEALAPSEYPLEYRFYPPGPSSRCQFTHAACSMRANDRVRVSAHRHMKHVIE